MECLSIVLSALIITVIAYTLQRMYSDSIYHIFYVLFFAMGLVLLVLTSLVSLLVLCEAPMYVIYLFVAVLFVGCLLYLF